MNVLNRIWGGSNPPKPRLMASAFIAVLMMMGLVGGFTPANASTSEVKVESVSYADAGSSATVKSEIRAMIDGATQVTWEVPNHGINFTKAQLRKAPRIKVNAIGANSSKVIAQRSKNASVVILKKGSCVRNTGKENGLRVGFVYCPKNDIVVVYDKRSKQYRHSHTIVGGRLVKSCLNYIGGKLPMRKKVVQVRYEKDVQLDITLDSEAKVSATAKASLECPTGTLYGEATAMGSAYSMVTFRAKTGVKVAATNAKRIEVLARLKAEAETNARANALAKIHLVCTNNPPPHDECPDIPGDQPEGYDCEPPPPPKEDTPPQISCTWYPHVYEKGGNIYGWCETIDPDGDTMSLNVEVDETTPYARVAGVVPSDVRWDGSACPAGTKCWRFTIWGDSPGIAKIVSTVTANGKSAVSRGTIEVVKDDF